MKKILIVDDARDVREIIRDVFLMEGYDVFEAANGNEGLTIALDKSPDLIVSDILMPGKDGYQLLFELRSQLPTKNIPVIFLSSKAEKQDINTGLKKGANDYLTKPLKIEDLITAVEKAI